MKHTAKNIYGLSINDILSFVRIVNKRYFIICHFIILAFINYQGNDNIYNLSETYLGPPPPKKKKKKLKWTFS